MAWEPHGSRFGAKKKGLAIDSSAPSFSASRQSEPRSVVRLPMPTHLLVNIAGTLVHALQTRATIRLAGTRFFFLRARRRASATIRRAARARLAGITGAVAARRGRTGTAIRRAIRAVLSCIARSVVVTRRRPGAFGIRAHVPSDERTTRTGGSGLQIRAGRRTDAATDLGAWAATTACRIAGDRRDVVAALRDGFRGTLLGCQSRTRWDADALAGPARTAENAKTAFEQSGRGRGGKNPPAVADVTKSAVQLDVDAAVSERRTGVGPQPADQDFLASRRRAVGGADLRAARRYRLRRRRLRGQQQKAEQRHGTRRGNEKPMESHRSSPFRLE